MKQKRWIAAGLMAAVFTVASGWSATVTNVIPPPGAMQPGGDANDTIRNFGTWFNNNGSVTEEFDPTMHSSENIAGSLHVIFDCPGGTVTPINSANLAFGNFLTAHGDTDALWAVTPASQFDASKYQALSFDININTAVSSNTPIPIVLWGGPSYANVTLTNVPLTTAGWQHIVAPISPTINLPDCCAYGVYDWYNTTASTPPAHVEYWIDNVMLVARPPVEIHPKLSLAPVTHRGLLFDSAVGEGGQRGAIDTKVDVHWTGISDPANPVTYAMTIDWVPDPTIYSNYEAHIFLAPNAGVGSPDWNLSDMGYLQILDRNDGTAIARMMWKTNDAYDNTMLFNEQAGGQYGTNGYAAGTLGYLTAPTMAGTWSISFTADSSLIVRGPGGVSTNITLPAGWVDSYIAAGSGATYAYFGAGPNGAANAGQPMSLSKVTVAMPSVGVGYTNDFSSLPLDTTTWGLLGNESVIVAPSAAWWVQWTLPATGFNLWSAGDLSSPTHWTPLSGNTNLAVPVTTYTWGTNVKALVDRAVLANAGHTFFVARKLAATKLQVLLPGETRAPYTTTGKVGTPDSQAIGASVTVTVNAVDNDWNIVTTSADTVAITSSDAGASLPGNAALAGGTGSFTIFFGNAGLQTVTATDVTTPTVTAGTSSSVNITQ